jgi:hypothetical protein
MNENIFFGPAHVVARQSVGAHLGIVMSESPVVLTDPSSTPIGRGSVIIEITTNLTGTDVLEACDYDVTTVPVGGLKNTIEVPVRLCIVEGSVEALGKVPGETVQPLSDELAMSTLRDLSLPSLLQGANDQTWFPEALIRFRPAAAGQGIPIIADPDTSSRRRGDISVYYEPRDAAMACEEAWADKYPNQRGLIVIRARELVDGGDARGISPGPSVSSFGVDAPRREDLCSFPRNIVSADVINQFVIVQDRLSILMRGVSVEDQIQALAHEIGHALLLDHGNGFDDDHDGVEPPAVGPRRFDFCDPQGYDPTTTEPREDSRTPAGTCEEESNVMKASLNSCPHLRPLQEEQCRNVAMVIPGATFMAGGNPAAALIQHSACIQLPCLIPDDIKLGKLQILLTSTNRKTHIAHTVVGPILPDANNRYAAFLDLDNNPETGCSPSELGFPTQFKGAELVTEVVISPGIQTLHGKPNVWRCNRGGFVLMADPSIRSVIASSFEAAPGVPGIDVVSIEMSDNVRGPIASDVRMEGLAQALGAKDQIGRLPASLEHSGLVSLVPPPLPEQSFPDTYKPAGLRWAHDLLQSTEVADASNSLGPPDGKVAGYNKPVSQAKLGGFNDGLGYDMTRLGAILGLSPSELQRMDFVTFEANGLPRLPYESGQWTFEDGVHSLSVTYRHDQQGPTGHVIKSGNISADDYAAFFGVNRSLLGDDMAFLAFDIDDVIELNSNRLSVSLQAIGGLDLESPDPDALGFVYFAARGGQQVPGDCNADGKLDISDAICVFGVLFLGNPASFPCGDGRPEAPGNVTLLDWQPDTKVNISDGIGLLDFLFGDGPPHPLAVPVIDGQACLSIEGCPDNPGRECR